MTDQGKSFVSTYFSQSAAICDQIDHEKIDQLANSLKELRERGGRLFILGVGGSAGNATHAVNDFRKLCDIESYAPTDNVSELTARTNDEGWDTVFAAWLRTSKASENDAILVFSVGGGNIEHNVSMNLVEALKEGKQRGLSIFGVVGRDDGYTAKVADVAIVIPTLDPNLITPHTEAFHAVVWHCLVSHPALQTHKTKW
ncbi:MAG: SIS domain-containing protein [Pseudomonadota bacterium]